MGRKTGRFLCSCGITPVRRANYHTRCIEWMEDMLDV